MGLVVFSEEVPEENANPSLLLGRIPSEYLRSGDASAYWVTTTRNANVVAKVWYTRNLNSGRRITPASHRGYGRLPRHGVSAGSAAR
jgi:hypothetical protein